MIIVNQIFGHAYGFRGNYDLLQPDFHGEFLKAAHMREQQALKAAKMHHEMMSHKISKRDVFNTFEVMLDK